MKLSRWQARWLLLAVAVILVIVLFRFAPASKMETAQRIVGEVHAYQTAHNRVPDSLTEIGEKGGDIHYKKLDDRSFQIWYQANADEKQVYDSVTNTWFRQP